MPAYPSCHGKEAVKLVSVCCVGVLRHDHKYAKLHPVHTTEVSHTVSSGSSSSTDDTTDNDTCKSSPADNIPPDTDRLKMAHNQIRRLQREVVYVTLTVKQSAVISPLIFEHFNEKFAQYSRTPGLQKI